MVAVNFVTVSSSDLTFTSTSDSAGVFAGWLVVGFGTAVVLVSIVFSGLLLLVRKSLTMSSNNLILFS